MSGQTSKLRIAILIDVDNTPSDRIEAVLNELAGYGTINVRRAYGNWKSDQNARQAPYFECGEG